MSGDIDLDRHLEAYLPIRDALGLTAGTRARLLRSFLDHAHSAAAPGMPIRVTTAVAWACDHAPPGCGDAGKAHRLMVARGFLTYLSAVVPGTEVLAYGLLAGHRRRQPYIFSNAEIEALTAAAALSQPRDGLRPTMLATLLGLLASTGLRIGEAIRLTLDDVRLDNRPAHLRVLESKFRKSRLVPVDPTTAAALADYVHRRHDLGYHALSETFFVNERGSPLNAGVLGCWFGKLTGKAGLRPIREGARRASLHSFRHSFAVRRLRAWHEAGLDVQALLPTLSVYLGHRPAGGHLLVPDRHTGPAAGGRLALHAGRRDGRCPMRTPAEAGGLIGPHLQAFFAERLLAHKRASPQTVACYRDTFRLLLRFMQGKMGTEPATLPLAALDADAVLAFLDHLERDRGCSVRSRNNRLAAIRSFFRVVALRVPDRLGAGNAGHGDPDQARRQAAGPLSEPR